MRHTRAEVIQRTIREFRILDRRVSRLTATQWKRLVPRPEGKDPWTVKDALAHITHFKADEIRKMKRQPLPSEVRGLTETEENHRIYLRWHRRSPKDVLAWHRQVQKDVLAALREAPDKWFTGRQRQAEWPFDLDGHSSYHRIQDIEGALANRND